MSRCLYCYQELTEGEKDFHSRCVKKIFGCADIPLLPYAKDEIELLAKKVLRAQTTLTGVQAKLSLNIEKPKGKPLRFTIVGVQGRYILKPQTEQLKHLPEVEDLTMHLANIAKIKHVLHSLVRFKDGELAYITKRIDRGAKGDKLAMEDMCQLLERLPEYKYKGSYEQIAKFILQHSATPKLDVVNFWEQVLFSWITGNADMHLKNFSLYSLRKGAYSLTPAYDMVSTALIMPEDTEELALTLYGKKRKIKRSYFEAAMSSSGLEDKIIEKMFTKFDNASAKWFEFIDISFLPDDMKERYKQIIADKLNSLKM
ncbi:MAG: HipA domain-containing protein [Bacteroidales bacterium]